MRMTTISALLLASIVFLGTAKSDSNKQAFCEAVQNPVGLNGLVNCTYTSFPQALKPYMNFCKANISGNVTYETHFLSLCRVEGYDQQVQSCMARRMEDLDRVIRIPESEVLAYTSCINAVERRVYELRTQSGPESPNVLEESIPDSQVPQDRTKRDLGSWLPLLPSGHWRHIVTQERR